MRSKRGEGYVCVCGLVGVYVCVVKDEGKEGMQEGELLLKSEGGLENFLVGLKFSKILILVLC